ncbi:unnamed protein product, partial [Tilletia caries]
MLEDTRPSLEDMCQEFNLCAGEEIVTDNAGNAAHLILRAVAYMSTRNPIHHANGGVGAGSGAAPAAAGPPSTARSGDEDSRLAERLR